MRVYSRANFLVYDQSVLIELEKETVGGVDRLQAHQTQSNSDRFIQHFGNLAKVEKFPYYENE